MKNILSLVVFMLITLTSYANELITTVPSKNVTTIRYNNLQEGNKVSIKDDEQKDLYTENIEKEGIYVKHFNLTALTNGDYTIQLEKDNEIVIKSFTVENSIVELSDNSEIKFFKPNATLKNNKLTVSQLTTVTDKLDVKIYYNEELIHADTISGAKTLSRIYQLSSDKKGEYIVLMKSADKTFLKNFTI